MTAAECTLEKFIQVTPNCGKKFVYVNFTTTNAADFVTIPELTTIEGFRITSTTNATVLAGTFLGNVLTLSNGATGTKIWAGIVWGV
jgi:hypothetical protein